MGAEAGGFIGGILVAAFLYFMYTKIKESRDRKRDGGSGGSGGGGGKAPGDGRDVHLK